jgi:uncharacterized protein YecE (DUF72 family)
MTPARRGPRVGLAGWSVVAAHRPLLGAGESALARYATRFDCVEINSSFYRSHQTATYERWAATVPAHFRFSVKLPQTITHELGLRRAREPLARFLEEVAGLGRRLGGVLVQLPPSLAWDARSANTFFTLLRLQYPGPVALEPRHASWFEAKREEFYQRYRLARVAADPPKPAGAGSAGGDASQWRYFRWHGSPRMYYSSYDDARLAALSKMLGSSRKTWCIFDNTAGGHAAGDAARLQALLQPEHLDA